MVITLSTYVCLYLDVRVVDPSHFGSVSVDLASDPDTGLFVSGVQDVSKFLLFTIWRYIYISLQR